MAINLPKSAVIRSVSTGRYLRFNDEDGFSRGFVSTREESVFNTLVKIEIEEAEIDSKFVHLRFTYSNRYWARARAGSQIQATSDQPDEDTTKSTCTLFEPIAQPDGTFQIRHVFSGGRVRSNPAANQQFLLVETFWASDASDNIPMESEAETKDFPIVPHPSEMTFTFVDLDTLVILPKHVAFKGHNDKYLRTALIDSFQYQELSSEDHTDASSAYEITTNPDGHIRIRSVNIDRFWRRSPSNWIWADSTDTVGNDLDTLFWPVKLDNNTIALRSARNNNFCRSADGTVDRIRNCLNAIDTTISALSRLKVEELVLERHVFNVRYRMEDARIFNEKASVAGFGSAINESNEEASLTIRISYEDSSSFTFSNSLSIMAGVTTGITTGIPRIAEGKVEISTEVTNSFEWNRTTEESRTAESQYVVVVPPKSWVRVTFVATRGTCSVPFSYTQRDKLARDGSFATAKHVDGMFTGVNYYSFHFEKQDIQPL